MNEKLKKILKIVGAVVFFLLAAAGVVGQSSLQPQNQSATKSEQELLFETQALLEEKESEKEYLHFKNEERLEEHFEKHNEDFGYANAEEYEEGANAVIQNPDSLCKLEKEDGDYVYYLESTREFVIVSPKGVIRTYYKADRDYFDRQ